MKFLSSIILLFAVLVLFPGANTSYADDDVTVPGDPITIVYGPGGCAVPPAGEGVEHAIDDNTDKYLNFCKLDSGFVVTPAVGPTIVTGLRFYTANDEEPRDPAEYKLEGSNNGGGSYTTISQGNLSLPAGRNPGGQAIPDLSLNHQTVNFSNSVSYTSYRLTFPTVKTPATAVAMQIGEVEILGLFVPTVTTQAVSSIGTTTATGNGDITDLGSPAPTQHGVCWSTSTGPTIAGSRTEDGAVSATGAFTSPITGLSHGRKYYVRAYATNTAGTSYGSQVSFDNTPTTLSTGNPSSYKVTVTKVELWNGTADIEVFSGAAQLDMVVGGTFPGINNVDLPFGTYSKVKVTFNNSFPVTGMVSYSGTNYYTTGTTFGGQTNLASTYTTKAGSAAEFVFRNPTWGALNADVTQTFDITPINVGAATDYQPTLRFTITSTTILMGVAGSPANYYLTLGAPTGSLVEP